EILELDRADRLVGRGFLHLDRERVDLPILRIDERIAAERADLVAFGRSLRIGVDQPRERRSEIAIDRGGAAERSALGVLALVVRIDGGEEILRRLFRRDARARCGYSRQRDD